MVTSLAVFYPLVRALPWAWAGQLYTPVIEWKPIDKCALLRWVARLAAKDKVFPEEVGGADEASKRRSRGCRRIRHLARFERYVTCTRVAQAVGCSVPQLTLAHCVDVQGGEEGWSEERLAWCVAQVFEGFPTWGDVRECRHDPVGPIAAAKDTFTVIAYDGCRNMQNESMTCMDFMNWSIGLI